MILSVFVTYPLAMIFSVFCQLPFGNGIVCLLSASLWLLAKGKFTKTDNIMTKGKLTNTDNIMAKG
jgi:hypothetical protein